MKFHSSSCETVASTMPPKAWAVSRTLRRNDDGPSRATERGDCASTNRYSPLMHSHTSVESSARTLNALERAIRMHETIEVRYSVENVQRSNAPDPSSAR